MTEDELAAITNATATVVKKVMDDITAPLKERLRELEARPSTAYFGSWRELGFTRGSLVSHNGSVWHCEKLTLAEPGTSADWSLVVKGGE